MREKEGAGQCTMSLGAIGSGDVPQLYNRLRFGVTPSFIVKKKKKTNSCAKYIFMVTGKFCAAESENNGNLFELPLVFQISIHLTKFDLTVYEMGFDHYYFMK